MNWIIQMINGLRSYFLLLVIGCMDFKLDEKLTWNVFMSDPCNPSLYEARESIVSENPGDENYLKFYTKKKHIK